MKRRINTAVLIVGFGGITAQLLLLRELLVVFSGNELSIGIILANWLILEAFGCFVLGKKSEHAGRRVEIFVIIAFVFSVSLGASVYLARILKNLLDVSLGEDIGFLPMLLSSFLILMPVSAAHGALFTFGCKIHAAAADEGEASPGRVYVFEVAGTICGGIAWTYIFIEHLHAFQIAAAVIILNCIACLFLTVTLRGGGALRKALSFFSAAALVAAVLALVSGGITRLNNISINKQWEGHEVVHHENSVFNNICVIKSGTQYTFFKNGIPAITTPYPDAAFLESFTHAAMLAHRSPGKILVLGGGAGGLINEILEHPSVKLVEYVEIDPLLLKLLGRFPTELTSYELGDERVKTEFVDGRLFIRGAGKEYDVIFAGAPGPTDLQTNRFFTAEFFMLAERRLAEDGILVFTVQGSTAHLNEELRNLNACIYHTAKQVFPHVRVMPGEDKNIFLASDSELVMLLDKTRVLDELSARGIERVLTLPWHIENRVHPRWIGWFEEFIQDRTDKTNLDFRPIGVFYSVAHWNAMLTPELSPLFRLIERISIPALLLAGAAALCLIPAFGRTSPAGRMRGIPFAAASTGFAGMVLDLALIFAFQSVYGYVFSWIGLLVTAFMAGSAAGAIAMTRALPRIKNDLRVFIGIEIAVMCVSLLVPAVLMGIYPFMAEAPASRIVFLALSAAAGLPAGAQFPLASRIRLRQSGNLGGSAGLIYGADLTGGWVGGVTGGIILLPVIGLFGTCLAVCLIKLCSFTIILTGRPAGKGGSR